MARHRLGALEEGGGGVYPPPLPMHPWHNRCPVVVLEGMKEEKKSIVETPPLCHPQWPRRKAPLSALE